MNSKYIKNNRYCITDFQRSKCIDRRLVDDDGYYRSEYGFQCRNASVFTIQRFFYTGFGFVF